MTKDKMQINWLKLIGASFFLSSQLQKQKKWEIKNTPEGWKLGFNSYTNSDWLTLTGSLCWIPGFTRNPGIWVMDHT